MKNSGRKYLKEVIKVNITSNATNQQCVSFGMHQEEHITFVVYSCHMGLSHGEVLRH